ncbi:MAG: DNA polymerase IV [Clostridia bacterium]
MKTILHIDMNAFFISCETAENPALKDVPAAVAGNETSRTGIILSPNYKARSYGVKTTMLNSEARRLCPDIILVPPRHELYEEYSRNVMDILGTYSDLLEPYSIDEAWMDVTHVQHLFGSPTVIARKIKSQLYSELGLTCSIGISSNKILSKMASDFQKPDGLTVLAPADIPIKMWPLPVGKLLYIGKKTEKKLLKIGITTIGELAQADPNVLIKLFGKYGETIHQYANGEGDDVVCPERKQDKSINHTVTLPSDALSLNDIAPILLNCCEVIGTRLRQDGMQARGFGITLRYRDFTTHNRQITLEHETDITEEIYQQALGLVHKHWNGQPVRLVGVYAMKLCRKAHEVQLTFFDHKRDKLEKLNQVVDRIRSKYGEHAVQRSSLIKSKWSE